MSFLSEDDVYEYAHGICFKTGPPGLVGAEYEWLVVDPERPGDIVPLSRLAAAVAAAVPLPAGSVVSYEPGGQLELSSPPLPGPAAVHRALVTDLRHLDPYLTAAGLRRTGRGLDPVRAPRRQLDLPRYAAMEAYFDARGPAGRTMMCSTASIQICLDIGADAAAARDRWRLLHRLGPVLLAAFADSPLWHGRPTGWCSTRQAVWQRLDRARPVPDGDRDPAAAWARYALDQPLLAIRRTTGPWLPDPGLRFRDWLAGGRHGRPTADDLAHHLSTLFPPIRPRGWFELRMIDALPEPWWPVPLAVAAALLDEPRAADAAADAVAALPPGAWITAARCGLADPSLARAARACFAAARDALPRMGASDLVPLVDAYLERYVEPGRSPAAELLCEVRR